MKPVILDTSPLCYLILLEQTEILPQLFDQIIIPVAVQNELLAEGASEMIQNWIAQPPKWLEIRSVTSLIENLPNDLGIGEREAISLAISLNASLIVLDDFAARQAALSHSLTVTGLLGVLFRAGVEKLLDFPSTVALLQQTSFRASPALIQQFLERYQREN